MGRQLVGRWYLVLLISFLLILIGLFSHWSILLAGALLPFVPMLGLLLRRRRQRLSPRQRPADRN